MACDPCTTNKTQHNIILTIRDKMSEAKGDTVKRRENYQSNEELLKEIDDLRRIRDRYTRKRQDEEREFSFKKGRTVKLDMTDKEREVRFLLSKKMSKYSMRVARGRVAKKKKMKEEKS